jgi:hypothetical protein
LSDHAPVADRLYAFEFSAGGGELVHISFNFYYSGCNQADVIVKPVLKIIELCSVRPLRPAQTNVCLPSLFGS